MNKLFIKLQNNTDKEIIIRIPAGTILTPKEPEASK
jgi:hypothetical protein